MPQLLWGECLCLGIGGRSIPCYSLGSASHTDCSNGKGGGSVVGEVSFHTITECKRSHLSLEVFSMDGVASLLGKISSLCNPPDGENATSSKAGTSAVNAIAEGERGDASLTSAGLPRLLRRLLFTIKEIVERQPCSMSRAKLLVEVLLTVNKQIRSSPDVALPMILLPVPLTNQHHFPEKPLLEQTLFGTADGQDVGPSSETSTSSLKCTAQVEDPQLFSFASQLYQFCLSTLQGLYFSVRPRQEACDGEFTFSECGDAYTNGQTLNSRKEASPAKQDGNHNQEKVSEDLNVVAGETDAAHEMAEPFRKPRRLRRKCSVGAQQGCPGFQDKQSAVGVAADDSNHVTTPEESGSFGRLSSDRRSPFLCQGCLRDSSGWGGPCEHYIRAATLEVALLQLLLEQYIGLVRGLNASLSTTIIRSEQVLHSRDLLTGSLWTRQSNQDAANGITHSPETACEMPGQPPMEVHTNHFLHAISSIIRILEDSWILSELLRPPLKSFLASTPCSTLVSNECCCASKGRTAHVPWVTLLEDILDAPSMEHNEPFGRLPLVNLRLLVLSLLASVRISFMHVAEYQGAHGPVSGGCCLGKTASGVKPDVLMFCPGDGDIFKKSPLQELVKQTAWILRSDLQYLIQEDVFWVTGPFVGCHLEHCERSACYGCDHCCGSILTDLTNYRSIAYRIIAAALQKSAVELFCSANLGTCDVDVFLHTHEDLSGPWMWALVYPFDRLVAVLLRSGLDAPSPLQAAASLLWNIGHSEDNISSKAADSLGDLLCLGFGSPQDECFRELGQDEEEQFHFEAALKLSCFDKYSASGDYENNARSTEYILFDKECEVNDEHSCTQQIGPLTSLPECCHRIDFRCSTASRKALTRVLMKCEAPQVPTFAIPCRELQRCYLSRRMHNMIDRWEKAIQRGALSLLLRGWNGPRSSIDCEGHADFTPLPSLENSELFPLNPVSMGPYFLLLICALAKYRKSKDDSFVWSFYVEAKMADSGLSGLG